MRPFLAARAMAVAFAIFWGYLFYGLIDLMVVFDRTPGFYESYLGTSLYRHGRCTAGRAGVQTWSALSSGAGCGRWDLCRHQCRRRVRLAPLLSAACLVLTAAILYALSRTPHRTSGGGESAHPKSAPHWPLLIVACVAIPPSILAAIDLVVGFWQLRPPTDDDTWSIDHWPMQATLALAIPDRRDPGFVQGSGVEDIALDCGDQRGFVGRGVTLIPAACRQSRRPRWVVGHCLVDSTPARRRRSRDGETPWGWPHIAARVTSGTRASRQQTELQDVPHLTHPRCPLS